MHCKNCGKEMEDTHSTPFGTGTSIYKCKNCGWSGSPPFLDKNPEDVYHHGIKYKDYKCVIEVIGPNGKQKLQFTTWRADIITAMMREGLVLDTFEPGDTFTIVANPNNEGRGCVNNGRYFNA